MVQRPDRAGNGPGSRRGLGQQRALDWGAGGSNDHWGGFPVVHAAVFDRPGSVKGGPYTHGPYPNPLTLFRRRPGQFVLMDVQDNGGEEVCITWTGKRYDPGSDRLHTLL